MQKQADKYAEEVIDGHPENFDAIEVHGVVEFPASDGSHMVCELDDENPSYFSVYLHWVDGGVACVGDFPTEADARNYAKELSSQYGYPMKAQTAPRSDERDAPTEDWVIYNPAEYSAMDGAGFWSNEDGWVPLESATRFFRDEIQGYLPIGSGPSQVLQIGAMQDFRLMIVENSLDNSVDQTPVLFHCFANDMEHATEQAENAYPGCKVLGPESEYEEDVRIESMPDRGTSCNTLLS